VAVKQSVSLVLQSVSLVLQPVALTQLLVAQPSANSI
jgi:hypothetical protein